MQNIFLRISLTLMVIATMLSCKKQETLIGKNLIPGSDYVNGIFTDTLTLNTSTVKEDSLISQNAANFLLGNMTDAIFGKSFASVYTQLRLNSAAISFNDTAFVDSAVLSIKLNGYYGDKNSIHNLKVYRLTEDMNEANTIAYHSKQTFTHEPIAIGEKLNYVVNLTDTFTEDNVRYNAALRIPIMNTVAQDIMNQKPDSAFKTTNDFQNYFKGLYIESDTTLGFDKGMMYLDFRSDETSLTIYYHTPATTGKKFRLNTNTSSATNTNFFSHNYLGTDVKKSLVDATSVSDTAIYVQSMAGVKAKINFPYLNNLGKILINKAEVEVTVLKNVAMMDTQYHAPSKMVLLASDSNGYNTVVIDQLYNSLNGFPEYGGTKTTSTDNLGTTYTKYKFSIAGQLQGIINNKITDYGFYLLTFPSSQIADRVMVGGGKRGDSYQMKLNLVYTKIP